MKSHYIVIALIFAARIVCAAGSPIPSAPAEPAYFKTGVLTFADRVWAQSQIERVYYNHRIWPKENKQVKPPFEQLLPEAVIEARAADVLKKSEALRQVWDIRITPALLQRETERMIRESRDPALLGELFRVLHDDATLVGEVLSRATLAERLIGDRYAFDSGIHGEARSQIEALYRDTPQNRWQGLGDHYRFVRLRKGRPGAGRRTDDRAELQLSEADFNEWKMRMNRAGVSAVPRESQESFSYDRVVRKDDESLEIESIVVAKRPFSDWWREVHERFAPPRGQTSGRGNLTLPSARLALTGATGCNQWDDALKINKAPSLRSGHTAVWTGTEMIIWGGFDNRGFRYTPSTDSWTGTAATPNVPEERSYHTAVWTGTEMIVWGGRNPNDVPLNTGGRYNPSTDSWLKVAIDSFTPYNRAFHTAVWTGSAMIIWGGEAYCYSCEDGGNYFPASDSWSAVSQGSNAPLPRSAHTAVWTGTEMIIWGGTDCSSSCTYLNTGGRYNPGSDSWAPINSGASQPAGRLSHTAVWTGTEMIVWGGDGPAGSVNTGGRYNPTSNTWTATSTGLRVPSSRYMHTAVWSGSEMLIWGGTANPGFLNTGARYNPSTNKWATISTGANVPSGRIYDTAIWTGSEMIVWGGSTTSGETNTGGRYDPQSNLWQATYNGSNLPVGRDAHTLVWTGSEMIVWGGNDGTLDMNSGGRYNPATAAWTPVSTTSAPAARSYHSATWTGTQMIIWGGQAGTAYLNTGGRYNPATDSWLATSLAAEVPSVRAYHTAVWTGSEMIVWGGYASGGLNSGGRYSPASNSWVATSAVSAPYGRFLHSAVWTGTEMIIWGGEHTTVLDTGGRYNPATDGWQPTSGYLSARAAHSAVWTGSEMIIWGGEYYSSATIGLNSGARYNPSTDLWADTSTGAGSPPARWGHTVVWTGTDMIVWGGAGNSGANLDSGSQYNPVTDSWVATPVDGNTPSQRGAPSVWTGSVMLIWGGRVQTFVKPIAGGIYHAGHPPGSPAGSLQLSKSGGINLSWSVVADAIQYQVKRCQLTPGACVPAAIVASPAGNNYTESMDINSYFYAVESVNSCGITP